MASSRGLVVLCVLMLGGAAVDASAQLCGFPADPVPTGVLDRPNEPFPKLDYDHRYVHSGTHLQGVRADEKWSGGLIHLTSSALGFELMTGAVIVNNPDPLAMMNVDIDFFDPLGAPQGTYSFLIEPEGFRAVGAYPLSLSYGLGSARVRVAEGSPPAVGATLQHAVTLLGAVDQDRPLSTAENPPGASSMQQLQLIQPDLTRLWWGPVPITATSPVDFLNGNIPWFHVVNPNDAQNTIQVDVTMFDRSTGQVSGPTTWRTVTLPPRGSLTEISGSHLTALGTSSMGLLNFLASLYGTPGIDLDLLIEVTSLDGLPIIGDGYLLDLLGPGGVDGSRFRMASMMMSSTPEGTLINPELSFDLPGGIIHTVMGVMNVGSSDAGPVTIQYLDSSNNLLGSTNVASLPPRQSLRIHPGTPGYPSGVSGFGWARVLACLPSDDLVGWTVREVLPTNLEQQYHKAYGEAMRHLNGQEPGDGWKVVTTGRTRQVMPLVRVDSTYAQWQWPGYTTIANLSVGNIGRYTWRYLDWFGSSCGSTTYGGLPFGHTSWTYEDQMTSCGGPVNLSGRVDHQQGRIVGIKVLGDPFDEYKITGFADVGY